MIHFTYHLVILIGSQIRLTQIMTPIPPQVIMVIHLLVMVILLTFLVLILMLVRVAMTTVYAVLPLGAIAMINQIIRLCCAPA